MGDFDAFWDASCATGVVESEGVVTLTGAGVVVPLEGSSIGFGGDEVAPVPDALDALGVAVVDVGIVDKDSLVWVESCEFCGLDAGIDDGVGAEEVGGATVGELIGQLSGDKGWIGTAEDATSSQGSHEDDRDEEVIGTEEQDTITLFEMFGPGEAERKALGPQAELVASDIVRFRTGGLVEGYIVAQVDLGGVEEEG